MQQVGKWRRRACYSSCSFLNLLPPQPRLSTLSSLPTTSPSDAASSQATILCSHIPLSHIPLPHIPLPYIHPTSNKEAHHVNHATSSTTSYATHHRPLPPLRLLLAKRPMDGPSGPRSNCSHHYLLQLPQHTRLHLGCEPKFDAQGSAGDRQGGKSENDFG